MTKCGARQPALVSFKRMRFSVHGVGIMYGLGFRVWGSGFGFRVPLKGLGFRTQGLGI